MSNPLDIWAFARSGNRDSDGQRGMPLRDYFAAHFQMHPEGIGPHTAKIVMGESPPALEDDPLAFLKWWADAEARLRYIHADAMLRARRSA